MRAMTQNKRKIAVAYVEGMVEQEDEYGNKIGTFEVQYSKPEMLLANVSPAKGDSEDMIFGQALDYDKTVLLIHDGERIEENSVFWIDQLPVEGEDLPFDYRVSRIADSLNTKVIAVKRVEVQ